MTAKLRSCPVIPMVSQIWVQSARSCSLRKRIARGAAVVPEVSFKSDGGFGPHSIGSWGNARRTMRSSGVFAEPAASTMAAARQIPSAASRSRSAMVCSMGSATSPWRRQARSNAGHIDVVAGLNRDHLARAKFAEQLPLENARLFLDLDEGPQHLSVRVEDRGPLSPLLRPRVPQSVLPRLDQAVETSGFHPLRAPRSAPKFATRFQT